MSRTSNDMLRALGLNVPIEEDVIFTPLHADLGGYVEDNEPTVMDVAGWGDDMGVDEFLTLPVYVAFDYAEGMGFLGD